MRPRCAAQLQCKVISELSNVRVILLSLELKTCDHFTLPSVFVALQSPTRALIKNSMEGANKRILVANLLEQA